MTQTTYFILGIVVGIVVVVLLSRRNRKGLIQRQAGEKEGNKLIIIEAFKMNQSMTNDDVQKLLRVSDATATRYLEDLEKEGIIRQVGQTGQNVYYERV